MADNIYDSLDRANPIFAEYLLKPSDVLQTIQKEGIEGFSRELIKKTDKIQQTLGNRDF